MCPSRFRVRRPSIQGGALQRFAGRSARSDALTPTDQEPDQCGRLTAICLKIMLFQLDTKLPRQAEMTVEWENKKSFSHSLRQKNTCSESGVDGRIGLQTVERNPQATFCLTIPSQPHNYFVAKI
jgi:hypothetical protein